MNRDTLRVAIRRAGVTHAVYRAAMLADTARNLAANRKFDLEHQDLAIPPADLLFETTTTTNHATYWNGGRRHAAFFRRLIDQFLPSGNVRICEWGCGVARVLRHLVASEPPRAITAFGTDYNPRSIAWCSRHIRGVTFQLNQSEPPLPFQDAAFDGLYSSSVYTHLPHRLQRQWLGENLRVVRPGGIVILSVHGDSYRARLNEHELREYEGIGIVVRAGVSEGGPWYTTYQSPHQVEHDLLGGLEIVHRQLYNDPSHPAQDVWVARKAEIA